MLVEIREDRQSNPVTDEGVAVSRPVIAGVLQSISEEAVATFGERDQLPLRMLGRLRKRGGGDCGSVRILRARCGDIGRPDSTRARCQCAQ
jgi:hypothetical protein